MAYSIWCNGKFNETATKVLVEGARPHRFVFSAAGSSNVLAAGASDPASQDAEILFGQPDPADCLRSKRMRWTEVTTAGYTRYDTPAFRESFRSRGAVFTNASGVFADSCAQHALAMMLSLGRQLLQSHRDQLTDHSWQYTQRRYDSRLLTGETVLLLGYGAIGRRLAALLKPFSVTIYAVRRQRKSEPGVMVVPEEDLTKVLPLADHVVNILSDNESTRTFVNARRLGWFKPGARFYNVGRGTTVDERALLEALQSGRLGAAYLDVFETEPLPAGNPLWTAPNCFITPHTAGGRRDQDEAIVHHFLRNLAAFVEGGAMEDVAFGGIGKG